MVAEQRLDQQYTPSAMETAFDAQIQMRFQKALSEPQIDQYNRLVRFTSPTTIGDKLVAFQYTRWDPLSSHQAYVLGVFKHFNEPTADQTLPEKATSSDDSQYWQEVEDEFEFASEPGQGTAENRQVLETIKQRIEDQGGYNPYKAVTDPSYFVPGTRISRWPEQVEFVIFNGDNQFPTSVIWEPPVQIGSHGMIEGKRSDIWGRLKLSPRFEGFHRPINDRDDKLVVEHPRIYHEMIRAYATVYAAADLKSLIDDKDFEIDDMSWSPTSKPFEHSIFPDQHPPEQIMFELGAFVSELCQPSSDVQDQEQQLSNEFLPGVPLTTHEVIREFPSPLSLSMHRLMKGKIAETEEVNPDLRGQEVLFEIIESGGKILRRVILAIGNPTPIA